MGLMVRRTARPTATLQSEAFESRQKIAYSHTTSRVDTMPGDEWDDDGSDYDSDDNTTSAQMQ